MTVRAVRLLAFPIAAAVALAFAGAANGGVLLDKVVAVVNDEAITWSELYRKTQADLALDDSLEDAKKRQAIKESEAAVLDRLIDVKLQMQEARKLDMVARRTDVEAAMSAIMRKYSMDEAAFAQAIRAEGMTLNSYRDALREQLTIRRLVDREVRDRIEVTEADIADFLKARNLKEGTAYRLSQIFLSRGEGGPDELAKRTAFVLSRLREGEDFSSAAAAYSDDPAARTTGGDLGYVEKENLAAAIREALSGLRAGEVTGTLENDEGVRILKLEDVKDVRQRVMDELFVAKYREWFKGLKAKAFVEIRL